MIRIIHRNFQIILSINLTKSEANILGLLPKPIILDFSPKSVYQHSSFISNHAWDISCCVGQLLHFHFIPNTPPELLLWICHNLDIISCLLLFISSVSHWVPLLSCCHFYCTLPLSILTFFKKSYCIASVPLLLPCTLNYLCFPLATRNIKFKLTFLSRASYFVPAFEPAHPLQRLPGCGSDLCLSSVPPKLLIFAPDTP